MKKEDVLFLNQLINSLDESYVSIERAYKNRNSDLFNKSKKIMLKIQKEISDITA